MKSKEELKAEKERFERTILILGIIVFAFVFYVVFLDFFTKLIISVAVLISLFKYKGKFKIIQEIQDFIINGRDFSDDSDYHLLSGIYFCVFLLFILALFLLLIASSISTFFELLVMVSYWASLIYLLFKHDKNKIRKYYIRFVLKNI